MTPYPLLFEPILKERVWGGRRLAELGKDLPDGVPIGESWELADLPVSVPAGRSMIVDGPLTGLTLREAIAQHHEMILGSLKLTAEGGFPLLVKLLDARENLSVQVHPDAAYVQRHRGAHLKYEAWLVLRAAPGAVIYKGVRPDVAAQEFARHIAGGTVVRDLVTVPAEAGQCHYVPAGTCHALGAGVVVAEVQTPSDTTFRVFDWGRSGRDLHIEAALECIGFGEPPRGAEAAGVPIEVDGLRTTPLLRTPHFGLERLEARCGAVHHAETQGQPEVWMVLSGEARVSAPGVSDTRLTSGTTALLPAALTGAAARLVRSTEILRITLPSPIDGLLA